MLHFQHHIPAAAIHHCILVCNSKIVPSVIKYMLCIFLVTQVCVFYYTDHYAMNKQVRSMCFQHNINGYLIVYFYMVCFNW